MTTRDNEFDRRPELIKKRARVNMLRGLLISLLTIYLVGSTTLLLVNAYQGAQTRGVLVDCTAPEGDCYQEGQKQTAGFIQQLIKANSQGDTSTQLVVVLAAACSEEPAIRAETDSAKRIVLLQDCVNAHLP